MEDRLDQRSNSQEYLARDDQHDENEYGLINDDTQAIDNGQMRLEEFND